MKEKILLFCEYVKNRCDEFLNSKKKKKGQTIKENESW